MAASDPGAESATFAPWDIVVVPFPYSERLAEKRRPGLVVSSDALHGEGYLWIAMITGSAKERRIGDVVIADLDAAGLPGPSMVRAAKIATIEPERIIKKAGSLSKRERRSVSAALAAFFAA